MCGFREKGCARHGGAGRRRIGQEKRPGPAKLQLYAGNFGAAAKLAPAGRTGTRAQFCRKQDVCEDGIVGQGAI